MTKLTNIEIAYKKQETIVGVEQSKLRDLKFQYEDAIKIPKFKKFIDKCFRYKNSYSCPEKPEDYWWVYSRVMGLDETALIVDSFQQDSFGKITIRLGENKYETVTLGEEIDLKYYLRQKEGLMTKIEGLGINLDD